MMYRTCSDLATNGKGYIPGGNNSASVSGGTPLSVSVEGPDNWHGPGSYPNFMFNAPEANAVLQLDMSSVENPFQPLNTGATQSYTINSDGSGTFSFMNWQDPGGRAVNGTETWTCKNVTG
ncbi:MAG: hypothetical protein JOY80_07105 [Candidatus Dormibacteraeota bacterium]|nr:hypothetical protein [Candidatus Dormibacteraeota bacterium]